MNHLISWKGTEMLFISFGHCRCWFKVISSETHIAIRHSYNKLDYLFVRRVAIISYVWWQTMMEL